MIHSEWFYRRNQFPKNIIVNMLRELWKFMFKFKFIYGLIQILNSLNFFEQAFWYMKIWSISIHFIDWSSLRANWVFQASYLSFGVLKLINSFQRLNQFAKRLRFLNKLFQLWSFSFFPSCFIDEIRSRFVFMPATQD